MKVLLTVPSLDRSFGGPVVKAHALAKALRSLGHSVDVAGCGEGSGGAVGLKSAFDFHRSPVPLSVQPLRGAVASSDLVHIIGFRDPVGVSAALFARRACVPYVLEPSGMHRRRIRSLQLKRMFDLFIGDRVISSASAIVATTTLEKRELIEDGVDEARIFVRPNGLALEDLPFRGDGIRCRYGIPANAPLVLHVGRIARKKGLIDLVRAVRSMEKVWLLIVGSDDGDGTLQTIGDEAQRAGGRVVIEPRGLWGKDKWAAYAESDVFCLHSETENFGNAAAEAASAGLPVVLTDQCGVAEFLDSRSSRIIRFGQIDELSAALLGFIRSSEARDLARSSAPSLREKLDWNRLAGHQVEIYEGVLEKR